MASKAGKPAKLASEASRKGGPDMAHTDTQDAPDGSGQGGQRHNTDAEETAQDRPGGPRTGVLPPATYVLRVRDEEYVLDATEVITFPGPLWFIGPFADEANAEDWADAHVNDPWWVVTFDPAQPIPMFHPDQAMEPKIAGYQAIRPEDVQ
jgi:hypothetical protein